MNRFSKLRCHETHKYTFYASLKCLDKQTKFLNFFFFLVPLHRCQLQSPQQCELLNILGRWSCENGANECYTDSLQGCHIKAYSSLNFVLGLQWFQRSLHTKLSAKHYTEYSLHRFNNNMQYKLLHFKNKLEYYLLLSIKQSTRHSVVYLEWCRDDSHFHITTGSSAPSVYAVAEWKKWIL